MKLEGEAAKQFAMAMCKGMSSGHQDHRSNGQTCPECGSDLVDSEGGVIHLDPPRKRTRCNKCCYRGWRSIEEVHTDKTTGSGCKSEPMV